MSYVMLATLSPQAEGRRLRKNSNGLAKDPKHSLR
jgi:hypothetical protein